MNILSFFRLKKQADLLDSRAYILKAFFAIMTAYFISINNGLLSKDIISVLFGLMLTLEAVTLTGIKYGLNQIYASFLGAVSTAAIISLMGINPFTVALSVAFTLYVCLKINWREVSPIAIFTSIYMTQYVQLDSGGNPSIWATALLRFSALFAGIIIAILFNFIFSFIFYRSIASKRILFVIEDLKRHVVKVRTFLDSKDGNIIFSYQFDLADTFNNIDWILKILTDRNSELVFLKKFLPVKIRMNESNISVMKKLRSICHMVFDINHEFLKGNFDISHEELKNVFSMEENVVGNMEQIVSGIAENRPIKKLKCGVCFKENNRIFDNLESIQAELYEIIYILNSL